MAKDCTYYLSLTTVGAAKGILNILNLMGPVVQYFIAVLYSPTVKKDDINDVLCRHFGHIDLVSDVFSFDKTDYYDQEMGPGLERIFFSLKNLQSPLDLSEMKLKAISIENHWKQGGGRKVNLDPGYLDAVKIVLASTKSGGHKIMISNEIYADMVLDYFKGDFRSFDWTFPDFKSGIYSKFLKKLRESYLKKIKE